MLYNLCVISRVNETNCKWDIDNILSTSEEVICIEKPSKDSVMSLRLKEHVNLKGASERNTHSIMRIKDRLPRLQGWQRGLWDQSTHVRSIASFRKARRTNKHQVDSYLCFTGVIPSCPQGSIYIAEWQDTWAIGGIFEQFQLTSGCVFSKLGLRTLEPGTSRFLHLVLSLLELFSF